MPHIKSDHALMHPMKIAADVTASTVEDLAEALLSKSDEQSGSKVIEDVDEQLDFALACDAFNLWRMTWRLREEYDDDEAVDAIIIKLRELICDRRGYDSGEFGLAEEATEQRARFPFGLDPLQYADLLAQKRPIRALRPEVQDPLCQRILGIAVQLQAMNGSRSVLLPIEQLRTLLKARKLIVGGAVKRLMKLDLLAEIGEKAHTGRAREFRVRAREGVDFIFEKETRTEPNPHL